MSCGGCSRLKPRLSSARYPRYLPVLKSCPIMVSDPAMTPANSSGLLQLLQPLHARLDCLAQQGGALLHLPLDHLAVETHLRRRSGRLLVPSSGIRPVHGVPSQSRASTLFGSLHRSLRLAQNMESSIWKPTATSVSRARFKSQAQ